MEKLIPDQVSADGQEGGMVPQQSRRELEVTPISRREGEVAPIPTQPNVQAPRPPAPPSECMPHLSPRSTPHPPPEIEQEIKAEKLIPADCNTSVAMRSSPSAEQKEPYEYGHSYRGEVPEAPKGDNRRELEYNLSGTLLPLARAGEPYQEDTANYYDWKVVFPELEVLVHGMAEIVAECSQVAAWKAWPEKHYDEEGKQDWKVFPFVHTFPAYDESRRTWVESTCARCPATTALLRRLPNIRTALFSRLGGGSRISGHQGWADLANHVLRCHLPLRVPSDGPCGLWVNEEVRRHVEGQIIVFDDSKLHKAFNDSTGDRLVLIVDMQRPSWIPLGTAEGEHTPELDAFIDAFR